MEKDKIITLRVPIELAEKVKATADILDESVGEFIKKRIDVFYNPPDPIILYVDKEIEVEKIVEKEVIREVMIDREGTVIESTDDVIKLDPKVYAVFKEKKLESVSMESYANNYIWENLERTRQYYERKNQPVNSHTYTGKVDLSKPTPTNIPGKSRFDYWNERIAECDEYNYEEQDEIREGIKLEQGITEPQRKLLQRGGTLRKS